MLFQSCFEIIEQVQLKNDGSGSFQLTLNMSKSKTKLNAIMKMQAINGHPVPGREEILARIKAIETTVSKTAGISNVKTSMDFNNYITVISFNFSNVTQLNKAVRSIKQQENATGEALGDDYSYDASTKIFKRKNRYPLKETYIKMSNADKEIFSNAYYTSIYKFESTVNSSSNKDALVSPSKKAVMLKQSALDVVTEKKSIENSINITR